MVMQIDLNLETPIYEQIKQNIIIGIANNKLSPGEKLPSVRQLAAELQVNMHTVAKAYSQLKTMGFLAVHRNKGAVVNKPDMYIADTEYFNSMADRLVAYAAEAVCKGVKSGEWISACNEAYEKVFRGGIE